MLTASQDFESFEDHTWLNCAHQGPLPRVAAEEAREAILYALKQRGIHIAFRAGKLRFSPHLYNTEEEIDHALSVLESAD